MPLPKKPITDEQFEKHVESCDYCQALKNGRAHAEYCYHCDHYWHGNGKCGESISIDEICECKFSGSYNDDEVEELQTEHCREEYARHYDNYIDSEIDRLRDGE